MTMGLLNWKQWGIKSRMTVIALFPLTLMFVFNAGYSYYSRLSEANQELEERGRLLASLLADSGEYGVISGNISYLERTLKGLIEADKSIRKIEILSSDRRLLIRSTGSVASNYVAHNFEAPIKRELVSVDSLNDLTKPHLPSSATDSQTAQSKEVVGYVVVTITPSEMLAKQEQRTLVQFSISSVVLLLSIGLALILSVNLTRQLAKTVAIVRKIRQGNYPIHTNITTGGEIAELQIAIVEMADSLDEFRRGLEEKVSTRTKALEAARDEALKSNMEKLKLIQKVNTAVEEERKLLSIEIHDQLNSTLIGIRLEAHQIIDVVKELPAPYGEEINGKARSIINLASDLYGIAREIVRRLRPEVIDALGLCGAVEEMIQQYDMRHPTCKFSFEEAGDFSDLADDLAIAAYRLIQEALSNVIKHAAAKAVIVTLQALLKDGRLLKIKITDDGKGFDSETAEPGIGLIGMRERVHGLGGQLKIQSTAGMGTTIVIELPFRRS
ncbi:MAG: ATP-binding protein [Pseudomonadota bacterium]